MIAKRLRKQVEQLSHEYQIPNLVLDETDKQILTILHEEGRISYTDLGKRVDLSRVAVHARINQLIEAGVIEKFTAVINPAKIGIHVSVFFNVEVEPQFLEEVALKLEEEPAVTSLYHMTGYEQAAYAWDLCQRSRNGRILNKTAVSIARRRQC